jgi:hypothetical protein
VRVPCLFALLTLLCGCSSYELRCDGPLRPINVAASAAAQAPAVPSGVATKGVAASRSAAPTETTP